MTSYRLVSSCLDSIARRYELPLRFVVVTCADGDRNCALVAEHVTSGRKLRGEGRTLQVGDVLRRLSLTNQIERTRVRVDDVITDVISVTCAVHVDSVVRFESDER